MQHTTNSIVFSGTGGLNRIDLTTGIVTNIDSAGSSDYGIVYNNEYYYCTPFGPGSLGVSKVYKVSDNGAKTVLYTETALNKNLLRIIGVTPNGVIAIIATTGTGKEYVSISGGIATALNFNTVANSRPSGDIGVGTSRTTNSLVYFVTLDTLYTVNSSNQALWVTDGTLAGTKKVFGGTPTTFAAAGLSPQFPGSAAHCGDDLYFNGTKGTSVNRLIYVNGSNYAVTTYPINAGVTTQPSFRKTASGIEFIALPLPTSSSEKAVYKVNCSSLSGIEDISSKHILFDLYPNPSNGKFVIECNQTGNSSIEIYNLIGALCYQAVITASKTEVDISSQPSGIYFVKYNNSSSIYTKGIVIE
jgi:hypothetical protein